MNNVIRYEHLSFVAGKVVDEEHKEYIHVFTHKRNGKVRKKKVDCIGVIRKICRHYSFTSAENWCFEAETLGIIAGFEKALDEKQFKYDIEKGEFRRYENSKGKIRRNH